MKLASVQDVADWRLCLGCGACAYVCPQGKVELVEYAHEGVRPRVSTGSCEGCTDCLAVCPGLGQVQDESGLPTAKVSSARRSFGVALEVWEGHASDPEVRHLGSSGGALTALALFCLESEGMHGVLHIGQDPKQPFRNQTRLSRSRAELLAHTGSRYAPASACDSLNLLDAAPGPCVFIGQPSEVTALRKVGKLRPALDSKVGLVLSFFCAGSPAMRGTIDLVRSKGVDPADVDSIRYRGRGWPGSFSVRRKGETEPAFEMTYRASWGYVQAHRPFSTHLWPDGSGEDADISCGDPWYQTPKPDDVGSSLVIVRTERGREILRRAREAGCLTLTPAEPWKMERSQDNLTHKRGAVWGRIATLRLLGLPAPRFVGYHLFWNWRQLPFGEKLRSTLGTARRVFMRRYHRRLDLSKMPTTDEYLRANKGIDR